MRVLLTGAGGFVGRHVSTALLAAGHEVRALVRPGRGGSAGTGVEYCYGDLADSLSPADWLPHLQGVDAVVNCAGILRERGRNTFLAVHEQAPQALYQACVQAGIGKVVQISALGDPAATEFIASKFRGDDFLLSLPLQAVVLRPSVIYSANGSYGGTSLLRALACLPALFLPGQGGQLIQPMAAEDLAALVLAALGSNAGDGQILCAGGPQPISLRDYLRLWREWLGLRPGLAISVPMPLVRVAVRLGEALAPGPFNRTIMGMLEQGNYILPGQVDAAPVLGVPVRSVAAVLRKRASYVQDRWHARLYFLKPLTIALTGLVWIGSAVAGVVTPEAALAPYAAGLHLDPALARQLDIAASLLDGGLGLALLAGVQTRRVLWLMLLSLLAYTAVFSLFLPSLWLEPLGGLLKNLILLPALLFLLLTEDAG